VKFCAALILILCSCSDRVPVPALRGSSWDRPSGTFGWRNGQVNIPFGLYYRDAFGADSFMGEFYSLDEKLIIQHDIGAYAGAWAQRSDAIFFEERVIDGARVWIAQRPCGPKNNRGKLAVVTFPDNDCANFYTESRDQSGLEAIRKIASSFRPKETKQSVNSCKQDACHLQ
jgi:hypothetical protein